MNLNGKNNIRVLAVDPSTRGFGFAVLEGPRYLIDWGVKEVSGNKNAESLNRVAQLVERYKPLMVVLENPMGKGSRRCFRVQELIALIRDFAFKKKIKNRWFSRSEIRRAFSNDGTFTKQEIACAITKRFPELVPRLPPVRKPWMSEDPRMSIFDSVSLALTYFQSKQGGIKVTLPESLKVIHL